MGEEEKERDMAVDASERERFKIRASSVRTLVAHMFPAPVLHCDALVSPPSCSPSSSASRPRPAAHLTHTYEPPA